MIQKLGKLEECDLRSVWKSEARDFTPWLAENIDLLSEQIGIDLNVITTEKDVGRYSCDILAETLNGEKVVIENQIEDANHDHLGKCITYAAGCEAKTIIWVVKQAHPEHKVAVEWLNKYTSEDINFFLVQVSAMKIDNSAPAPVFQIISRPDKLLKQLTLDLGKEATERHKFLLDFWTNWDRYITNKKLEFKHAKPSIDHWNDVYLNSSKAHISLTALARNKEIGCELYIPEDKNLYKQIEADKDKIEQQLGYKLCWMELPEKKASRVILKQSEFDLYDTSAWGKVFAWYAEKAADFIRVFYNYIK